MSNCKFIETLLKDPGYVHEPQKENSCHLEGFAIAIFRLSSPFFPWEKYTFSLIIYIFF